MNQGLTLPRLAIKSSWQAAAFAAAALILGGVSAYAVSQVGPLALLLLPAAALFLLAVILPEAGLWVLLFVTYAQLSNVLIINYGLPSIAQPLAALMLVVVLVRAIVFGDRADGWQSSAGRLAFYGFALLLVLVSAIDFTPALTEYTDYIKDALLAVIVTFLAFQPSRFKNAIWVIIITGGVIASIGAYQHLTNTYSFNYWGYGNWIMEVSGSVSRERITGPFANPNAFAQVLVVIVPLALERLWHERNQFMRLVALWSVVASGLAIFFTYSRGGFLALVLVLVLLLLDRRPSLFPLLLTAILGLFLLRLLPATYTDRISTLLQFIPSPNSQLVESSFRGRLSENTAGLLMFRDHPIFGVGQKNFPAQYQDYSRQLGLDPRSAARSPASLYIEVMSEQGLVGLLVFAYLLWYVLTNLRKAVNRFNFSKMEDSARIAGAFWVGLIGYLTVAINKNSAYSNIFWLLIGLAMAIINASIAAYRTEQDRQAIARHQEVMQ